MEKKFEPITVPLITCDSAEEILQAYRAGMSRARVSLDLELSTTECLIEGDHVFIDGNELRIDQLQKIREDERTIYILHDNSLEVAEIRAGHYYKLVRTSKGHAPTLEIDGIHMHRVKDTFPELDAEAKVRLAGGIRDKQVLDTCMGLGYTAIVALRMGARRVVTVEKDENVYELARINPWSRLLGSEKVVTVIIDVREFLSETSEETFDIIIHDPPRFSMAGELYSAEFYRALCRVLRPGGRVVHYVGSPGRLRSRRIHAGVMRRMREAGFRVFWDQKTECVYGYKATC